MATSWKGGGGGGVGRGGLLLHRFDISANTGYTLLLKNPPVYEFYGMFPAGCSFPPSNKRNAIRATVLKSLPNDYSLSLLSFSSQPSRSRRCAGVRASKFPLSSTICTAASIQHLKLINQPTAHWQAVWIFPTYKAFCLKKIQLFKYLKNSKSLELEKKSMCESDQCWSPVTVYLSIIVFYSKYFILDCLSFALNLSTGIEMLLII